jgi:hypothetical protein
MRVLLINPKRVEGELAAFPLGLAYIAAVVLCDAYQVDVVDLNGADNPNTMLLSRLTGAL